MKNKESPLTESEMYNYDFILEKSKKRKKIEFTKLNKTNYIKSEFLAEILTEFDEQGPITRNRIEISGARIKGKLKLAATKLNGIIIINNCVFEDYIDLCGADIDTLDLSGSKILGVDKDNDSLIADRLKLSGSIFLRMHENNPFECKGNLKLIMADIGNNIYMNGAKFYSDVNLRGCKSGGSLYLYDSEFKKELSFKSSNIGDKIVIGKIKHESPLNFGSCKANGIVFKEKIQDIKIIMNGLSYNTINIEKEDHLNPINYNNCLEFLKLKNKEENIDLFQTQPFDQLSASLKDMGQNINSNKILLLKEHSYTKSLRITILKFYKNPVRAISITPRYIWRMFYFMISNYGYRISFALAWSFVFIIYGTFIFQIALENGLVKPSNPILLRDEWNDCLKNQKEYYYLCFKNKIIDYPSFDPLIFSLDSFIPFTSLRQEEYWIIKKSYNAYQNIPRYYYIFLVFIGWAVIGVVASALGKFVKNKD